MRDLLAVAMAVGVPGLVLLVIWRWARGPRTRIGVSAEPDRPVAFGYKSTWLAVRSDDPGEVVEALRAADRRFRDAMPCNWEHGIQRVFGALMSGELFVTPSLRGWVLVAGYTPDAHPAKEARGRGDSALRSLERLGAALDRPVHYFGSHRGVSYVDWVVVEGGEVRRAYAHADGKTYYDVGDVTPAEIELGLVFPEALTDEDDDERAEHLPDESTVIELASRWTLSPLELDAIEEPSVGVLVRLR